MEKKYSHSFKFKWNDKWHLRCACGHEEKKDGVGLDYKCPKCGNKLGDYKTLEVKHPYAESYNSVEEDGDKIRLRSRTYIWHLGCNQKTREPHIYRSGENNMVIVNTATNASYIRTYDVFKNKAKLMRYNEVALLSTVSLGKDAVFKFAKLFQEKVGDIKFPVELYHPNSDKGNRMMVNKVINYVTFVNYYNKSEYAIKDLNRLVENGGESFVYNLCANWANFYDERYFPDPDKRPNRRPKKISPKLDKLISGFAVDKEIDMKSKVLKDVFKGYIKLDHAFDITLDDIYSIFERNKARRLYKVLEDSVGYNRWYSRGDIGTLLTREQNYTTDTFIKRLKDKGSLVDKIEKWYNKEMPNTNQNMLEIVMDLDKAIAKAAEHNLDVGLDIAEMDDNDIIHHHDKLPKILENMENKEDLVKYQKRVPILNILAYEGDEYKIIVPQTLREIKDEGNAMGHCVGTYTRSVANANSTIVFLRDKEGSRVATVEIGVRKALRESVHDNRYLHIVQARSQHNGTPPDDAQDFLDEWLSNKSYELDSKDIDIENYADVEIDTDIDLDEYSKSDNKVEYHSIHMEYNNRNQEQ